MNRGPKETFPKGDLTVAYNTKKMLSITNLRELASLQGGITTHQAECHHQNVYE